MSLMKVMKVVHRMLRPAIKNHIHQLTDLLEVHMIAPKAQSSVAQGHNCCIAPVAHLIQVHRNVTFSRTDVASAKVSVQGCVDMQSKLQTQHHILMTKADWQDSD